MYCFLFVLFQIKSSTWPETKNNIKHRSVCVCATEMVLVLVGVRGDLQFIVSLYLIKNLFIIVVKH